uniref:Epidermal growth factor receptor substrate 15-like 1 n=1 Tax=Clastoptera arizonana TaxID=38151 RepID=A0A1B6DWE2_9HEMI
MPNNVINHNTLLENNNTAPYSNPELDMISKDIEELVHEKQMLEGEILQKEADIKIKNGEVKSLQGELDTLAATLKQLETQKGEAQKRLNDLKNQTAIIESELSDVKLELEDEQKKVDNLMRQAEEQETSLKEQEEELASKKQELEGLKEEETRLERQQEEFRERLDTLSKNLQDSQLQISQVKASISQVQEQQRQMNDAIALAEDAISSGDASSVPDTCLNLQPEFREPSYTRHISDQLQAESSNDPFSSLNGPADSGGESFVHNNAFSNDPFQNGKTNTEPDPFASANHFSAGFTSKPNDAFSSDPFNSFGNTGKSDPFDPFPDGSNRSITKSPDDMAGKDPFGCDPFASLHPPTSGGPPPRPESPSPALPPKKSKQPPPRPAPPKAILQSTSPSPDPFSNPVSQTDPFSMENDPFTNTASSGGFADFSNFNSKFSDTTGPGKAPPAVPTVKLDFTEDPFRDYRYEDPFNISFDDAPAVRKPPEGSSKLDPFGMEVISPPSKKESGKSSPASGKVTPVHSNGKSTPSPLPSEDQQLAWAAKESLRLEEERRKAAEQEQIDLERALTLSKKEGKKRTGAFARILS